MPAIKPLTLVRSEPGRSRYAVLAEAMRARILRGEWPPGTALPAEQTLAADHGVALGTIRQALQLLVDQGLIERIHGRGTFVRSGLAGATMLRFFRFGDGHGEVPTSRIVSRKRMVGPADVGRRLGAGRGDEVLHLLRVRSVGGAPCLLENIWLPLPSFEPLAESSTADWGDLLYPLYAARCGITIHRAVDELAFGSLSVGQARYLELRAGHPCVVVTRTAFDIAGRGAEVRATRGDAHAFHYTVTLT
jgi:GntR family transcriptional regulator